MTHPHGQHHHPHPHDHGTNARHKHRPPAPLTEVPDQPPPPPWPPPGTTAVFQAAINFIEQEEDGPAGIPANPYWPSEESGITWGVGFDARHHTAAQIRASWASIPKADLDLLAACAGQKGSDALLKTVKHIKIPKDSSLTVFTDDSLPDYYSRALKAFPRLYNLPARTQVALLSLIYNRGPGMGMDRKKKGKIVHDRRYEMRRIRQAVANYDLQEIANQLRDMERIWVGTKIQKNMTGRRERESALVESDIAIYLAPHTPPIPVIHMNPLD